MKSNPHTDVLHQRVLQAACALFLKNGYRVSMDAVALEAGVSKQTVYAHFASKESLFKAAAGELMHPWHTDRAFAQRGLIDTLVALAQIYQQSMLSPDHVALDRMLIAEAPRFPQVARMLFDVTLGELQRKLAARLAQAMAQGELRHDDPGEAAELYLSMLAGLDGGRRLLGVPGRSRKAQARRAGQVAALFLQAYAPVPPAPRLVRRRAQVNQGIPQ